jgi:hypothetical protein
MSETYKAIEVSRPGQFSQVSRPLLDPGPGQVRIRIEACGVCHSDSDTLSEIVISFDEYGCGDRIFNEPKLMMVRPSSTRWSLVRTGIVLLESPV